MMYYILTFLLFLSHNSLCSIADEPIQKIKAVLRHSQWNIFHKEIALNNLDIHKKRFLPNELEITAGATFKGEQYLELQKIPFKVLDRDLKWSAEEDAVDALGVHGMINGSLTFQRALSFEELLYYIKHISQNSTEARKISVVDIGKTYEGRKIKMIKIEHPDAEKIAFINGGIYGRESITVMTALYFIEQLIMANADNPVNKINWFIVPCLNPDGYIYSQSHFRFHKSNRNLNNCSSNCSICGVDLESNFKFKPKFEYPYLSHCSFLNPGIHAFSELESRALVNTLKAYVNNITTYIALHSYGCNILYPSTYNKPSTDAKELIEPANFATLFMNEKFHKTNCKFEVHHAGIAQAPPGSMDYAKEVLNIKYSYTIELQEGGRSGFYPTKHELKGFLKQNYDGIKSLCCYIAKKKNKMEYQQRAPNFFLKDYSFGNRNSYLTFWFYGCILLLWIF